MEWWLGGEGELEELGELGVGLVVIRGTREIDLGEFGLELVGARDFLRGW